jgi:hypothetical protein
MHVYKGAILEIFAICREACDVDVFLDSETEFQSVATSYLFPTLKIIKIEELLLKRFNHKTNPDSN